MSFVMNMGGKSPQEILNEEREANLLEAGAYEVALTKIEKVESQAKKIQGKINIMLRLTFTVQAGAKQGRTVQRLIGVDHESTQYINMSRAFIAKLAKALNRDDFIGDLGELMNRPVIANVIKVDSKDERYGPQNDIKSFAPAGAPPRGGAAAGAGWQKPKDAQKELPMDDGQADTTQQSASAQATASQSTIAATTRKPWERLN